jgi:multiple sugar transport system permease protein
MGNTKLRISKRAIQNISGYLFILPFLIGFFWLTVFPIGMSFYLSFTRYDLLGSPEWVGFSNYIRMFTNDEKFIQALKVTFFYAFTAVPFRLVFALLVALLLARVVRGSGFYRTALYLPSIIGGSVAVAVMWRQLFGNNGAINGILSSLGLPTRSWLGDPDTAIWTLILLFGWQFGSSMLIFLAGLKNIPQEFYEAASVDGANAWYRFTRITIPLLTPVILFNLVMQLINGFLAFTPSFIITEGGPLNSTLLYALYLYQRGFVFFDMGYASAMAWILLLIIAFFTAFIFGSSKYWVHYESGGGR